MVERCAPPARRYVTVGAAGRCRRAGARRAGVSCLELSSLKAGAKAGTLTGKVVNETATARPRAKVTVRVDALGDEGARRRPHDGHVAAQGQRRLQRRRRSSRPA